MASGKTKSLMHDLSGNDCMYFTFVLHLDQSGKKKFFSLKIEQSDKGGLIHPPQHVLNYYPELSRQIIFKRRLCALQKLIGFHIQSLCEVLWLTESISALLRTVCVIEQ